MLDNEFIEAFENCTLPSESFHHADHIRLAWIYTRRLGPQAAVDCFAESIRRFAAYNGSPEKYDDAVTRAWMLLIANAVRMRPSDETFADFAAAHRELFDKTTAIPSAAPREQPRSDSTPPAC